MSLKIIKFSAEWCGPCKTLKPVFDKIVSSMPSVTFQTVDIDEEPELASSMNVRAVPTIVFIKDGEIEYTLVGMHKEELIRERINDLL